MFALTYLEMLARDPIVAMHRLAIDLGRLPVKQALSRTHLDLAVKVEAEVDKLATAGFIRKVNILFG